MKDEESGAQMQGCGAQPSARRERDGLPAPRAAHPHFQRSHYGLRGVGHVVRQRRLWHHVRRHHMAAGVLRRVRGGVRDAAARQESDI